MKLSNRANMIKPSLTRKLFNQAKQYNDVIDLTLGDPDFNTPDHIKEAGVTAIRKNKSHYSMNAGIYEARVAVSKRVREIWNVENNADENIIITVGGMEALYLALQSIVDDGDEVIIFAPYYVNYYQMIQMCGGEPVIVDTYSIEDGLNISEEILEKSVTEKTTAIIINSPNNPTGGIVSKESLNAIFNIAEKYDLMIISDEVYRTLIYDDNKHESILQFKNAARRTILVDSLSKEFCMTGWRIGYALGPKEVISAMTKLQENVAACANVPAQYALITAYSKRDMESEAFCDKFSKRRDILCNALKDINGIKFRIPEGTFYLFVNISELGMTSEEFAYGLLTEEHVAVVPGKAYGDNYDGYIRIAFTKDTDSLISAAKKIKDFISRREI